MHIKPYQPVVLSILRQHGARVVLDMPCGTGWLGQAVARQQLDLDALDGLGLWEFPAADLPYRQVTEHDLDSPMAGATDYDAIVCGEAIHLLRNPGLMLHGAFQALRPGGRLIITTPNTWRSGSRLGYLLRGFHYGFAPMVSKQRGDYVTYVPWSFPQLHVFLAHQGYTDIMLHEVNEPKPKHLAEYLAGWPSRLYCRSRQRAAGNPAEHEYWRHAGSAQALYGSWLVVSARRPA
ncbi:bifunctional 2-polyprenyl-6-hydroxyphenol methylase/3-demethylubiquinol 3-O-methyltransferase UbiG [Bordetella sp. BOR01]|uniref:class I SAM-dependent methyltransferase n=1 Tax=Bordetella sp. BOR01 TaxID=2854779 RepID=UPI001C445885|nr:methyltransferase domain-containing protein [Bordetella sp. BOR01]MBV7481480.1 methyltransferase domain-containing protein [Bordetella sp. BOR01]